MPDVIKFYLIVIYWYMFFGKKSNLHLDPNIGHIAQYWALHGSELNLRYRPMGCLTTHALRLPNNCMHHQGFK